MLIKNNKGFPVKLLPWLTLVWMALAGRQLYHRWQMFSSRLASHTCHHMQFKVQGTARFLNLTLLWWKHQAGLSPSNARLTPHIQACWLINAPSQKCWLLRNKEVAFHHAQPVNQTMPCCREARYSQSSQLHSSCWPVLLSIPFRVPLPPSHEGYTISNHTRTPRADLRQILIALAWSTWYPDIGTEVRDGRFKKDTEPHTTATALVKAHARISWGKQLIGQQPQGYYTDLRLQVPSSACSKNSQLYCAAERTDCSYVVGNWDNNTNLTLWHQPSYRILATPTSFCYCAHLSRSPHIHINIWKLPC